jgi:hypothetical protein
MFKKTEIGPFNGCDIIIDSSEKTVEPRDEIKGLVARAHLYMAKTYSITLEPGQDKIMQEWNQKYPPSEWEKEWNSKIFRVTGKNNSFITGFVHPAYNFIPTLSRYGMDGEIFVKDQTTNILTHWAYINRQGNNSEPKN